MCKFVSNIHVVQRLAVVERAQKRAKKLTPPSVRDKLLARPHLVIPRFFHRSAKPILRQKAEMELVNLGVP